jgi:mannose-6-phosphate isomerase-like protein (cupin superfamily)
MADSPVAVTKFASKSHDSPVEVRAPNKTRVEVVRLPGYTIGRMNLEPGWKWSECIKPVVKTDSCQNSHVGYVVSGRLTVKMNDGTQKTFEPGTSYAIPPGHDAWVESDEFFHAFAYCSARLRTASTISGYRSVKSCPFRVIRRTFSASF